MTEFKFSCPDCGQHLAGTPAWVGRSLTCPTCQRTFIVPSPGVEAAPVAAASPPSLTVGAPLRPTSTAAAPPPPPSPTRPTVSGGGKMSGLAVASLICAFVPLGALPAVILGHLALSRIKSGRAARGKGFAIAGLILGYLGIALTIAGMVWFFMAGRAIYNAIREAPPQALVPQEQVAGPGVSPGMDQNTPPPFMGNSVGGDPSLTLKITPNKFFAPKECYSIRIENKGLGSVSWTSSGVDVMELKLDSDVLDCTGTLRVPSQGKVEIKLTAKSSKRFRLQFTGVNNVEAKVDGKPLDLSQEIPAGTCTIVVTASASSGATAP